MVVEIVSYSFDSNSTLALLQLNPVRRDLLSKKSNWKIGYYFYPPCHNYSLTSRDVGRYKLRSAQFQT